MSKKRGLTGNRASKKLRKTPITSKEVLVNTRADIARKNKSRASTMEKEVAAYLKGSKTPQSGSGSTKGDCIIPLIHHPGTYLVECKLSAMRKGDDYSIRLRFEWLDKMQKDATSLRSNVFTRFAVLIFKYHRTSSRYVLFRELDIDLLCSLSGTDDFKQFYVSPVLSLVDKPRSGYNMVRSVLERHMQSYTESKALYYPSVRIVTPVGTYICIHLSTFKELLRNE